MPTDPQCKTSRSTSKRARYAPTLPSKIRTGLAVDTSFSRHRGNAPEQVFPQQSTSEEPRFVSLSDVKAFSSEERERRKNNKGSSRLREQLENAVHVAPPVPKKSGFQLQPPPQHKRVRGLRPAPLELGSDVSPSDRAIPIGIAVPSAALSNHTHSPHSASTSSDSPPHNRHSQRYGQEVSTPTIVVTPAKEDFDHAFTIHSGNSRYGSTKHSSSLCSGQRSGTSEVAPAYARTPPVPPLPLFATQSNASLRSAARESTATEFEEEQSLPTTSWSRNALSVCTTFEEDEDNGARSAPSEVNSRRRSSQSQTTTPRQSKGWWNVITSPFVASAKSGSFSFRSPPIAEEDEDLESEPMLSGASEMGHSDRSGPVFSDRGPEDDELRSAPTTDRSAPFTNETAQSFGSGSGSQIPTPMRSETAPGALDLGSADEVNIYRAPSEGLASAYYDSNRSFPSMNGPPASGGSRGMDDFDDLGQGQSFDQEAGSASMAFGGDSTPINDEGGIGDDEFYQIPTGGSAAPYYDSNRSFPSMTPHGEGYGDPGVEEWSPRQSVGLEPSGRSAGLSGGHSDFVESPMDMDDGGGFDDDQHLSRFADEGSLGGGSGDRSVPNTGNATNFGSEQSYASGRSPFDDSQSVGPDDYNNVLTGQSQVVERSPFDSGHAEFEGFSGAYGPGERQFFATPSTGELNGQTPGLPLTGRTDPYGLHSPMSETTPVVEDAHLATFMGPKSANGELREVDVASMRSQTPLPTSTGLGLASATMASRGMHESTYDQSMMSEKIPYTIRTQHTRNDSYGLGISDDGSERELFPPSQAFSEKDSVITARSGKFSNLETEYTDPSRPWYHRFFWLIAGIAGLLLALLIVLLVMFVPQWHNVTPVQAQWLNLTGFPPLPTGIATVVRPYTAKEVSGCVVPAQLWSCDAAPVQGGSLAPDERMQPSFRFEIMFRNHTLPSNETAAMLSNGTLSKRNMGHAAQGGAVVRRSIWSNYLFTSSPSPPSEEDQSFLGRTTDQVNELYNGEETPFYISLLNASSLVPAQGSKLRKRDSQFHYPYPSSSSASPSATVSNEATLRTSNSAIPSNIPGNIPTPLMGGHGMPAEAELYPFAYAQPLRLFNRGQNSEHYGFYTYFDRSVYISSGSNSTLSSNSSSFGDSIVSNVPLSDATAVCTWSQTRMLVQIWTRQSAVNGFNTADPANISAEESSANDLTAPGSFPYAVTVTLDRHGGDAKEKGLYCYGLDEDQKVMQNLKTWIDEDRGFDGTLVHPAIVPTNDGSSANKRRDDDPKPVDGGTGGCSCQWRNWKGD